MRILRAGVLVFSALGLTACGGRRAVELNPNEQIIGSRWNATLSTPAALAGAMQVRGTGWMGEKEGEADRTEAHVSIANAAPGGVHPWHVHIGRCGVDQGILGSAQSYEALKVNKDGRAEQTAELDLPVPRSGQYFVNVHASASNMGTIIACGNLAPPSR